MKSLRLAMLPMAMLVLLATQAQSATLQYASGGFAVTPFLYGKINIDTSGQVNPPVMEMYNPGPALGIKTLSGSKAMEITSDGLSTVQGRVSWNLQADYGKNFTLKIEARNWVNQIMVHSENRSSLRVDSQDGLFLQVAPGAGEKLGQPVKLYLSYEVLTARNYNEDNDPAKLKLESNGSQPNRISVNGVQTNFFSPTHVGNYSSSGDHIPWPSDYSAVKFHSMSYDGPWPYKYECWQTGENIEAGPGDLIYFPGWPKEYLRFDHPLTCKIGDLIGLNLGLFQEVMDVPSDLGGYPGIDTEISFSLTPHVIPLPGSVFLMGTGFLLLVAVYTRRRS